MLILLYLLYRGIAKAGKKLKTGGPSRDPTVNESEKQAPIASKASIQNPEDPANDPPPETDTNVDPMNTDADPPNPKSASPAKSAEEIDLDKTVEDVLITGTGYTEPGNPTVLAKHRAKEEPPAEGKLKLDLENYAAHSAVDIHAGYLNRLHTSRELEAGLVNLMKECYEV